MEARESLAYDPNPVSFLVSFLWELRVTSLCLGLIRVLHVLLPAQGNIQEELRVVVSLLQCLGTARRSGDDDSAMEELETHLSLYSHLL